MYIISKWNLAVFSICFSAAIELQMQAIKTIALHEHWLLLQIIIEARVYANLRSQI